MPVVPDLVVILGAGASQACAPRWFNDRRRPPLTSQLFDPRFEDILSNYGLAEAAAADIRIHLEAGTVALEEYLRERLRRSTDPRARARYLQIPLYLQHILIEASTGFTRHPENYDRLVNAALALESAVFITLNYDVILDNRLFLQSRPLRSLDSYVSPQNNWMLIKLHGSTNWARALLVDPADLEQVTDWGSVVTGPFTVLGDALEKSLDASIVLRTTTDVREFRWDNEMEQLYFPAISMPLGSKDELVCPDDHTMRLRRKLASLDELNLLVIGYSGLDQEVLGLLRESNAKLKTLCVVNAGVEHCELTMSRILEQFDGKCWRSPEYVPEGFNDWAQTTRLDEYFARLP